MARFTSLILAVGVLSTDGLIYGPKKGILNELFRALSRDADMDWVFIDGSIVRAHQHSCGARTADNESIGKS